MLKGLAYLGLSLGFMPSAEGFVGTARLYDRSPRHEAFEIYGFQASGLGLRV